MNGAPNDQNLSDRRNDRVFMFNIPGELANGINLTDAFNLTNRFYLTDRFNSIDGFNVTDDYKTSLCCVASNWQPQGRQLILQQNINRK